MKKIILLAITSLLAISLVGCGNGGSGSYAGPTEWTEATSREISSLDYVTTALATNHEINMNLVDGLLEHDNKGTLVPSIAESWSANDDSSVWTFNIRQGVKWVTNTGEEYGEVTAHDFVTGLRHGAEFKSGTAWLFMGVIEGYTEYFNSDYSDAEFEKVGVKAIDDYTLEFTMEIRADGTGTPIPYFDSMVTYAVAYPVNKEFLESRGAGCTLGAPDTSDCSFGTTDSDSILYNGAYLLSTFDEKSQTVLVKNQMYWDAPGVYLEKITRIYDDGSDPYSAINGFEQGTYVAAGLVPTWADYADYAEKYADNAYFTIPNSYVFGLIFNFNRQSFEQTNYADDLDMRQDTRDAMLNTNFRKALQYSVDRIAYLSTRSPEALATATLRNIDNIDAAGTTSDGKGYYTLVEEAYAEMTGETVSLVDGQTPFYDPAKAMEYINAAKAEGVNFPIHLDMLVPETSDALVKQANSLKQSVETSTEGNIIIELVLRSQDTVEAIAYENTDPAGSDYDISNFSGWGPDYQDPKTFVDIYSPTTGYYMHSCGLGTLNADGTVADEAIKETVGFMQYEEYYRAADAIADDLDARYATFAKADAFLIDNALYIPMSQQTRSQQVSRIVPFTRMWAPTGTDSYKYKGVKLQEDIVTADQYAKAEADWAK